MWRGLILILMLWFIPSAGYAQNYTTLYSQATLRNAASTYTNKLREVWQYDLLGRLTAQERQAASNIRLQLPLIGRHAHPFDFYADTLHRRVTIPILSVKFFDDIAIATAWLERHNCDKMAVSDYVGLIRYQNPTNFPGRRFPPPLGALGVPSNALDDPWVNDVSGKALKSAIYFLMAHELAHVCYGHSDYSSITIHEAKQQESQADTFALNIMRRISVPPIGMSIFFLVASRFEPAPGDFDTLGEFEAYLRERATHPLTSDRLMAIAQFIRDNVDAFTRGQSNPSAWIPRIRAVANEIEGIGKTLDDRQIRELQRRRSERVTLSDLANACQ